LTSSTITEKICDDNDGQVKKREGIRNVRRARTQENCVNRGGDCRPHLLYGELHPSETRWRTTFAKARESSLDLRKARWKGGTITLRSVSKREQKKVVQPLGGDSQPSKGEVEREEKKHIFIIYGRGGNQRTGLTISKREVEKRSFGSGREGKEKWQGNWWFINRKPGSTNSSKGGKKGAQIQERKTEGPS